MASGELAISVRGLAKTLGHRRVIENFSIDVPAGHIFGFLGPNGSGKTTTIRMLCGLLTPDAGTGRCLGHDLIQESAAIKREVGYMPQRFGLYEDLSIRENLDFVARLYGVPEARRTVGQTLERLGLAERARQLAGQLSGGWKQRLALAACLLHAPRLLLLDEPTAGVDPKARREFWDQIHDLAAAGMTVLVSTHYMDEAERCHEVGYLAGGQLLVHGSVDAVLARSGLTTFEVAGPDLEALAADLRGRPGVEMTAAFGASLHVSGTDPGPARSEHRALPLRPEVPLDQDRPEPRGRVHPHAGTRGGHRVMSRTPLSWRRFRAVLIKEFIQMRRDRLTFGMMIGVPLLQLILFGYAINTDPKQLPTALLVADQGVFARSLVRALENSDYFEITRQAASEADADGLLARGDVQFVISIPEDFGRELLRGQRPAVLVEADATDPVATGNALAALATLSTTALAHDLKGPLASLAAGQPAFELRVHRRYNPEGATAYNIVPGLIGTILTMTMVMMTAIAVTRERERGTLENLLSMPVRPIEVMLGKIVPFVVVGYIQVAVILIVGKLLFGVPVLGSLWLLSLALVLFIAANLAVGFTFSTLAENQLQAMQMTFFFFLPSLLLSGFLFPFRGMPEWAQALGSVFPLTHFLRIVRGILLKGSGWSEIAPEIWPIVAFMLVAGAIALNRYRETLD